MQNAFLSHPVAGGIFMEYFIDCERRWHGM